jgi:hypothetical protein
MYGRRGFPHSKKLIIETKGTVGFDGNNKSMLRILKTLGFRYERFNDRRKFLTEQSDIVAANGSTSAVS